MTMIHHDRMPLREHDLATNDLALIGREAGSALRWIYRSVASEPLPDRCRALLEQLAAGEEMGDPSKRRVNPGIL